MKRSRKGKKSFLAAVVAVVAISALVASSAAAAVVPAKFSGEWAKPSTTGLTLKKNGLEPKNCTFQSWSEGWLTGSQFWFASEGEQIRLACPSGSSSLNMVMVGEASYDTVTGKYNLHFNDYGVMQLPSPWGYYNQVSGSGGFNASWTNGSGSTASTFTLANQTIGAIGAQKLTLSGTVKVTASGGGLITLSH